VQTIRDRLERLEAEAEPIDRMRLDADFRVMLNALLSVPGLGEQLPCELDEFLLGGNAKAEPLEHTAARDRLYRTFKPIEQYFRPLPGSRPKDAQSEPGEPKSAEARTRAEAPQ
jgi:hypothetical protein